MATLAVAFLYLPNGERARCRRFMDEFARRHGYADATDIDPMDVLTREVMRPHSLLELATEFDWFGDERIGCAIVAALDRDDLHACALIREVTPARTTCASSTPWTPAILAGYRDLAAGRVFASSGDFKADMAVLDRKEADGWR